MSSIELLLLLDKSSVPLNWRSTFLDTYQTDFASKDTKVKAFQMTENLDFGLVGAAVLGAFGEVAGASLFVVGPQPAEPPNSADTLSYYDDFDEPVKSNDGVFYFRIETF